GLRRGLFGVVAGQVLDIGGPEDDQGIDLNRPHPLPHPRQALLVLLRWEGWVFHSSDSLNGLVGEPGRNCGMSQCFGSSQRILRFVGAQRSASSTTPTLPAPAVPLFAVNAAQCVKSTEDI